MPPPRFTTFHYSEPFASIYVMGRPPLLLVYFYGLFLLTTPAIIIARLFDHIPLVPRCRSAERPGTTRTLSSTAASTGRREATTETSRTCCKTCRRPTPRGSCSGTSRDRVPPWSTTSSTLSPPCCNRRPIARFRKPDRRRIQNLREYPRQPGNFQYAKDIIRKSCYTRFFHAELLSLLQRHTHTHIYVCVEKN